MKPVPRHLLEELAAQAPKTSRRILPTAQIQECKGACCTIYSGGLPEFPDWFEPELNAIIERLQKEMLEKP